MKEVALLLCKFIHRHITIVTVDKKIRLSLLNIVAMSDE